jgi:hypothetical protein
MNLFSRLINKEYTTSKQNYFLATESKIANCKNLFLEADYPADCEQEQQSHAASCQEADAASLALLALRSF